MSLPVMVMCQTHADHSKKGVYRDVKIIMLSKLSRDIKSKDVDSLKIISQHCLPHLPVSRQVCICRKTSCDPILNS